MLGDFATSRSQEMAEPDHREKSVGRGDHGSNAVTSDEFSKALIQRATVSRVTRWTRCLSEYCRVIIIAVGLGHLSSRFRAPRFQSGDLAYFRAHTGCYLDVQDDRDMGLHQVKIGARPWGLPK